MTKPGSWRAERLHCCTHRRAGIGQHTAARCGRLAPRASLGVSSPNNDPLRETQVGSTKDGTPIYADKFENEYIYEGGTNRPVSLHQLSANQVDDDEVLMDIPIEKVTSSEVSKRFGFYYDEAMTHPIATEINGVTLVVMLPASKYERLTRLDRTAVTPEELSDEATRSLRPARAPAEAIGLNCLMD